MSYGRISEFAVGVAAPILVIAAYAAKQGIPIGAAPTILAAVLAGGMFPVLDRFLLAPLFKALNLGSDKLLQQAFRGAVNAALGLGLAVWLLPAAGA